MADGTLSRGGQGYGTLAYSVGHRPNRISALKGRVMKTKHLLFVTVVMAILLGWATVALSQNSDPAGSRPGDGRTLTVFAAASLTDVFQSLAAAFSEEHGDVQVIFNFAGSQQLAHQLAQDAPADVFASADAIQMEVAVFSGRVRLDNVAPFAGNRLLIAMPADNPGRVTSLQDLARSGLKLVIADEGAPIGHYTQTMLANADGAPEFSSGFSKQVNDNIISYERNVRAVLSKVMLGEVDAGVVYWSDVMPARAETLATATIPDDVNVFAAYPIAPVADSPDPALAAAFVDFVRSPAGQEILASFGFLPASALGK